ncbi:group II intron reverse transcriptase/maturase [Bacillus cereus group sp. BceL008]|uniref:group II intron reverse transcriptase/maturase n=1 Tax=Bacillus cereus group sp. BceL008 TaxID=3445220 RepID=UPI003F1FDD0B
MGFKGRTIAGERDLLGFQDKMYQVALEGKPIYSLTEFMKSEPVIDKAIHNIKSNRGSQTAGVDGTTINDYLQMDRKQLINLIQSQIDNYNPSTVRRTYIPKGNTGKLRPLGIPVIVDRIIQEIARMAIEPYCEAKFYPHSYGFRPYRSSEHAIARIVQNINSKAYIAIEGDIKGYFDNINHNKLLAILWEMGIKDKQFLFLIKKMLKSKILDNGNIISSDKGTPQGGIISPLLANVYLNNFDWMVSDLWESHSAVTTYAATRNGKTVEEKNYQFLRKKSVAKHYKTNLVRYADDWIILTETKEYAEKLLTKLRKYMKHQLSLELSEEKTVITDSREEPLHFLGFRIKAEPKRLDGKIVGKVYPDWKKILPKVSEISKDISQLRRTKHLKHRVTKIELINSKIIGLSNYYSIAMSKRTFSKIDHILFKSTYGSFRKLYGKNHTKQIYKCCELTNRAVRHDKYNSKTYAETYQDTIVGITKCAITKIEYARLFNPTWLPYTPSGRNLWHDAHNKRLKLHLEDIWVNYEKLNLYANHNNHKHNFEYFMNRPYAIKRDKAKCSVCKSFVYPESVEVHHKKPKLPLELVNKVSNLTTLCLRCHKYVHNNVQVMELNPSQCKKVNKLRKELTMTV